MIHNSRGLQFAFTVVPVEIHAIHKMDEGSVYVWMSESDDERWTTRVQGCKVDCGSVAMARVDAVQYADRTFHELFPEHDCSPNCVHLVAQGRACD
jgi:hypothetical protein